MNRLTLDDINKYQNAKLVLSRLEQPIIDRIEYIVDYIHEVFNGYFGNWYFEGAQEGEIGSIPNLTFASFWQIEVVGSSLKDIDTSVILKDGQEWGLRDCHFPIRWLYEDFEEELKTGIKLFQAKKKANAEKRKERISKKAELVSSAKSKLTKAELRALKSALTSNED